MMSETPISEAAALTARASQEDPAAGLAAVAGLRVLVTALEEAHVHRAREQGWSWQKIAEALGVTRQTVHKKYVSSRRRSE